MITWDDFIWFALLSILLWAAGAVVAMRHKNFSRTAMILYSAGGVIFTAFIVLLWVSLGRPPLKTMGETRLWYSFFMAVAAMLTYSRWHYRWVLGFSTLMASVFIMINLFRPEIHSQTLMPALQSGWFVPHVTVYIFSYALFGCAFLLAAVGLATGRDYLEAVDNLTAVGVAFFTIGMMLGSLWAKEAWGAYWNWDPKETWAAVTWMLFIFYLHLRRVRVVDKKLLYLLIVVAFCALQMCWWGVNLLPAAHNSIHAYTRG